MNTLDLEGSALDWAVAKAAGMRLGPKAPGRGALWFDIGIWSLPSPGGGQQSYCLRSEFDYWLARCDGPFLGYTRVWQPSADWEQGGPIIAQNRISLTQKHDGWWRACIYDLNDSPTHLHLAHEPLIAAMRCFVASKLGHRITIPKSLL